MIGLMFLTVVLAALSALAIAALRWGVDSRTMTEDRRPVSLFVR